MPQMTIAQLRAACYKAQTKLIPTDSKWYADDCANIRRAIAKKSKAQLLETLSRWNAINATTQKEIDENCQFDGFFTSRAGYV